MRAACEAPVPPQLHVSVLRGVELMEEVASHKSVQRLARHSNVAQVVRTTRQTVGHNVVAPRGVLKGQARQEVGK